MGTQLQLNELLTALMPEGAAANVYHKPPSNLVMKYPCIRYAQNDEDVAHADNFPYRRVKRWEITIIEKSDSGLVDKIASLPMSSWNRAFTAENLNHTVYNLFF